MKIVASPMPALIAAAEFRVNMMIVVGTAELAHEIKRRIAFDVLDGHKPPPEFVEAARIEGVIVMDLAERIANSPNQVLARDNARRGIVLRLHAATSQAELDAVLAEAGVPPLPPLQTPRAMR